MAITDWPASERPREKCLQLGAAALSDAELLAIFFRVGTQGKSAVDLARESLHHFGSLRALLGAEEHQFCRAHGLGQAKFVQLQAVLEMARRHLLEDLQRGEALTSPDQASAYLKAKLRDYHHEVFACLWLDTRHRVILYEELFRGTLDGASVYPREVVKAALKHNAAAVIFAHNHPSGIAEPSRADEHITRRLKDALGLVDIRVLDHIVIGDGEHSSLANRGLL
ncbi:DNA repair protein RadC [gamma proteobacterium HTCC5015]|nr:DNA repair protein RadC [gamma proteobacterium HTCC5015]